MEAFHTHWKLFGNAYIGCTLLAICCSYLGVYVILRRIVFFGMGVIQLAALGVACSFLFGYNSTLCATLTTFLGIAYFIHLQQNETISKENLIGIIYIAAGAFALLVIKQSALGTEELKEFFYGNILLMNQTQFILMTSVFVIVMVIHLLFFQQILFVAFDRPMAETLKIKARIWDIFFYFSLGIVIAVSTKTAGSMLVFGYLILPATTALISKLHIKSTFVASIFYAVFATWLGLYFQHSLELPPAQTILASSTIVLIFVTVHKYKKWLQLIILITLCSGFYLFFSHTPPHHKTTHDHVGNNIAISTSTGWANLQKNKKLQLQIANNTNKKVHFYLQIDFIIEFLTIEIIIDPAQIYKKDVLISDETLMSLEQNQELLLSCWEDVETTLPKNIVLSPNFLILAKSLGWQNDQK